MPQRVIRTETIDRLERANALTRLPRALKAANDWRKLSGTSAIDLLREGLAMRGREGLSLSQLVMAANAPMLTKAALVDGRLEAGVLPSGQNAGLISELPSVAAIIASMIAEAEEILTRLGGSP
jgi:NAD(P)H-dependent flavin oxidoreductase YrpB (nitropropane dioxygenase family)